MMFHRHKKLKQL